MRVILEPVTPLQVMYLNTKRFEDKVVVISKRFDKEYLSTPEGKAQVRTVPVYPSVNETSEGIETIFHGKNEKIGDKWYGRPDSLPSFFWKYTEAQTANVTMKIAATDIVAKKILAFEKANPARPGRRKGKDDKKQNETDLKAYKLRKLTTAEGGDQSHSLAVIDIPFGAKMPTSIDLEINRDTAYLRAVLEYASSYIYSSHRWSPELTGFRLSKGGLSGNSSNILDTLFKIKDESVVRPYQREMENFWSQIFTLIANFTGQSILAEHTVCFPNTIKDLITSLNDKNTTSKIGGNQTSGS